MIDVSRSNIDLKWFLIPIHIFKYELYIYGRDSFKKTYKQQPNNLEDFHLESKNCKLNAPLHMFLSLNFFQNVEKDSQFGSAIIELRTKKMSFSRGDKATQACHIAT